MNWISLPGWATDKSILTPLLPPEHSIEEIDFNFFNESPFPSVEHIASQLPESYGIICYSLGTLVALKLSKIKLPEQIICIGGFSHFPGTGALSKRRKLQIRQMMKGIRIGAHKTVLDFCTQAQLKMPQYDYLNENNLLKGLELLKDCDMSQASESETLNIFSIYGNEDNIVPEVVSQQLMVGNGKRKMVKINGGHGIIHTHADTVKELIKGI